MVYNHIPSLFLTILFYLLIFFLNPLNHPGFVNSQLVTSNLGNSTNYQGKIEFVAGNGPRTDYSYPEVCGFSGVNFTNNINAASFVVIWEGRDEISDKGVFGRIFDRFGNGLGDKFLVNTETTYNQYFAQVACLEKNHFVVVWQSHLQDSSDWGIFAQIFNSTGGRFGSEFQVNSNSAGAQTRPEVFPLRNGGFFVSWSDSQTEGKFFNTFENSFAPIGGDSSFIPGGKAVELNDDGDLMFIRYTGNPDRDYRGQIYDSGLAPKGNEFIIRNCSNSCSGTGDFFHFSTFKKGGFVVLFMDFINFDKHEYTLQVYDSLGKLVNEKILDRSPPYSSRDGDIQVVGDDSIVIISSTEDSGLVGILLNSSSLEVIESEYVIKNWIDNRNPRIGMVNDDLLFVAQFNDEVLVDHSYIRGFLYFQNEWECNNIGAFENSVCSTRGLCYAIDACKCFDHFEGVNCEKYRCNDFYSTNNKSCSGSGTCVVSNNLNPMCQCYESYYGNVCGEFVQTAYYQSINTIAVLYIFNASLLDTYNSSARIMVCSCSERVEKIIYQEGLFVVLGIVEKCYWILDENGFTEKLIIEIGTDNAVFDKLFLYSVTNSSEIIPLVIEYDLNNEPVFDIIWLIIIISGVIGFVGILIITIILISLMIVICRLFFIRKLRNKLNNEDFELLDFVSRIKMDKNLFSISINELVLEKQIAAGGGNAIIYKGKYRKTDVAIKRFTLIRGERDVKEFNIEFFERELRFMLELNHPNICLFHGFACDGKYLCIVMELCEYDLKGFFQKNPRSLTLNERIRIVGEIASVMNFLHAKGVVHRDLKLENILLGKNKSIKLIDFGLTKKLTLNSVSHTKAIGTPKYMAPEITLGKSYDEKIDLFAFGIILYEVFSENYKNPYGVESLTRKNEFIQFKIANDEHFRPNIDVEKVPKFIKTIAKSSWSSDPNKRVSFSQIESTFKKEYFQKKSVTLYVKLKNDNNENAVDVELSQFSITSLKELVEDTLKIKCKKMFDNNNQIKDDYQVVDLKDDTVISVEIMDTYEIQNE